MLGRLFMVAVRMTVGLQAIDRFVIMKVKQPHQSKHHHNAEHHPVRCGVDAAQFTDCMWQQMKHPDAQHQPTDETDHRLHARVGQVNPSRQPATCQRSKHNQDAVAGQQHRRRYVRFVSFHGRSGFYCDRVGSCRLWVLSNNGRR